MICKISYFCITYLFLWKLLCFLPSLPLDYYTPTWLALKNFQVNKTPYPNSNASHENSGFEDSDFYQWGHKSRRDEAVGLYSPKFNEIYSKRSPHFQKKLWEREDCRTMHQMVVGSHATCSQPPPLSMNLIALENLLQMPMCAKNFLILKSSPNYIPSNAIISLFTARSQLPCSMDS